MSQKRRRHNYNYEDLEVSRRVTRLQCKRFLFAVANKDIDAAVELIYNGICGDTIIQGDRTAISLCMAMEQYHLAKMLLIKGCTLTNIPKWDYLLHLAVESKDLQLVLLLSKNMNISAIDHIVGKTPLHVACELNISDIAKMLIKDSSNSSLNISDKGGRTPLMYACRFSSSDIVNCLLKKGASVNVTDHYGRTPLFECLSRIDSPSVTILKSLLKAGANINTLITSVDSPLLRVLRQLYDGRYAHEGDFIDEFSPGIGRKKRLQKMAILLIDYNCNVNVTNSFLQNALHFAVCNDDKVVFDKLLSAGCQMDIFDRNNCSPLMYAFRHMNQYFVEVLINCGANLELYDWEHLSNAFPYSRHLIDYAKEKSIQLQSLKAICRLTIRNRLTKPIDRSAKSLFLPQSLISYIFKHEEE